MCIAYSYCKMKRSHTVRGKHSSESATHALTASKTIILLSLLLNLPSDSDEA
jgi:hypothetical protein